MTNQDLQNSLLALLESGYTVLAESERFVHQVQRLFRLKRIEEGKSAWDAPKILTLNRWMDNFWTELWPEELPASSFFLRWRYLKECLDEAPPPEPLNADVELIHLLDESLEQCLRYAIDPAGGKEVGRLIEWRRRVWLSFNEKLARTGLFHSASLPEKIVRRLTMPEWKANLGRMAFVGFEFAGSWEKRLLEVLQKKAGAVFFALPAGNAQPQHLVYTDPEQEITGLVEDLLASVKEYAPHEIAVALCDPEFYSPAVSDRLRDILGEPVSGERAAYNLYPDRRLSDQGIYNAAVLPIRCALGGVKRNDLFAFLRSPYYGSFSPWNRHLSLWDRTWREKGIESGIELTDVGYQIPDFGALTPYPAPSPRPPWGTGGRGDLRYPTSDLPHPTSEERSGVRPPTSDTQYPTPDMIRRSIAPFLDKDVKTVSKWTETCRSIWSSLQFPVLANELDRITWDNLVRTISEFEAVLGETGVSASEFFEVLNAQAGRVLVQKSGFEDAGFQILGRLDPRGLCFRKLLVPGLVSGSFPHPVRPLPLLSSQERRTVLGGTIESQFAFARCLYANWLAAAPQITISRPAISKDGEPIIPSPFWTKEGEKMIHPVIPWKHRLPAMQRARWVQQSVSKDSVSSALGSEKQSSELDPSQFRTQPFPAARPISVSELQSALLCPARYFFRHVLGLEALDEFEPGVLPLERGKNVHAILASFVLRAMKSLRQPDLELESLTDLLKNTITDGIGPRMSQAVWQVEFERLAGKPGFPGLLVKWLEAEWERMRKGWSWVAVERQFENLEIEGCEARLKGRLDRIDSHPEQGALCWDYKTGKLPLRTEVIDENGQPQLKAYLLAMSKGAVTGAPKASDKYGAGFIELTSPGSMKHQAVFDPAEEHGPYLKEWEKEVASALNSIFAGDVSPIWLKQGLPCEENCEYKGICGAKTGLMTED
jgi:RecB family exonuclease